MLKGAKQDIIIKEVMLTLFREYVNICAIKFIKIYVNQSRENTYHKQNDI